MRLFFAIDLDEAVKDELEAVCGRFRGQCEAANFTRRENLHITLAFLGETAPSRLPELRRILDEEKRAAFPIVFDHLGRFARRGGDIYFAGVQKSERLLELERSLTAKLRRAGFPTEEREYVPHLTLAREAVLRSGISPQKALFPVKIQAVVSEIALMQSEWIRGRLIYSKVFVQKFNQDTQ